MSANKMPLVIPGRRSPSEAVSQKTCRGDVDHTPRGKGLKWFPMDMFPRRQSVTLRLLVVACALATCTDVSSQNDSIVGKQEQLPEVTVTDNKHQQAQRSTAPSFAIDRSDMLRMGTTDMADALHRLPGVTLRDYGGAGGMKTVCVRGFGAKHTGVSYDGVALGESQNGEIDVSRYGLDNLSALQLNIGDNDHIFISARQASTPAMLSIETIAPVHAIHHHDNPSPRLTTQLRVGSFDYISPMLRFEQQLSSQLTIWAVGDYIYAKNDYPFRLRNVSVETKERRANSRMNQGHAEVNMRWELNSRSMLGGKAYYYDNDRQLPGIVHYYTSISRETLRDRNAFGQLFYQTRWDNGLSLKLTGKMNWAASFYDNGLISSQIINGDYWQREYYTSMSWLYAPSEHWAFNYAADYILNNLNSTLPTDTRPLRHSILQTVSARFHSNRLTASFRLLQSNYINKEKDYAENANDETGSRNQHRLSPSVSLSYLLTEGLRLRCSFKDIFRMPTFNENYYYHFGSRTLLPEKTQQWNLGVTFTQGYRKSNDYGYSLSLDAYYNQVKDMIVAVPYNMFVWRCVNVGKVHAMGVDFTARWQQPLTDRQMISATVNYSLQRVVNRTNPSSPYYNNQIAYIPANTGGASLSWENPWLNLSIHGEGISSRWTNNEHLEGTLVNGYWEMGTTIWRSFRLTNKKEPQTRAHELALRFDLKNMFNKQYEIVGAYPMPGRNWQFTIGYQF